MLQLILWIIVISLTTVLGSWYAKKYDRPDALIGLYIAFVAFSNIAATKIADYNFGATHFFAPAAAIIFPVTFLLTDIVNEKYGRAEVQRMIFIAFITQVIISAFTYLVVSLPSAPFWTNQAALQTILDQVPRITLASWAAFLVSENLDAYIFSWFKGATKDRHLWMRNAFSSLPSMLVDSLIFVTIAFAGNAPLWPLIIGVTATKWIVGLIDIPLMYLNKRIMQKA